MIEPPTPPGCCGTVVSTTPTEYEPYETCVDFGSAPPSRLTSAKSKGYWSWSRYDRRAGQWLTRVTAGDASYVNSTLGAPFNSPRELADFLESPVYGDTSKALMRQLVVTLLDLECGYISWSAIVRCDGEFLSIGEIVERAREALAGGDKCERERWKDLLDAINNNYAYIAC